MTVDKCDPCECVGGTIANDKFKQDVESILCLTLEALGYTFPADACNPCACIGGNIGNDKFKQDVEILLCSLLAAVGGGSTLGEWNLLGNAGTVDGTNFVGTTDNIPFTVRVNNAAAFRVYPATTDGSPSLVGGNSLNVVSGLSLGQGSSILSGGSGLGNANTITQAGATQFAVDAVICGGANNHIGSDDINFDSNWAAIVSGFSNSITANESSFIGSGTNNVITNGFSNAVVAGNGNIINVAGGSRSLFIGSGETNSITSSRNITACAIVDGAGNLIHNCGWSTIGGGENNTIIGNDSFIAGGYQLKVGDATFGFQGFNAGSETNLSAFDSVAFFGEVDLWLGNQGTAGKFKLFGPNADFTYVTSKYTSFRARAQTGNIEYILPDTFPTAGQVLTVDSVSGTDVTLKWV